MLTQPQKRKIALQNGNALIDKVIEFGKFKNDAGLAHTLDVGPPVISNIRHGRLPVNASFILKLHEKIGMPVKEIRAILEAQ